MSQTVADTIWRVIRPAGNTWSVRFSTEDAAWARILPLNHLSDTPRNRAAMRRLGWRVEERDQPVRDEYGGL